MSDQTALQLYAVGLGGIFILGTKCACVRLCFRLLELAFYLFSKFIFEAVLAHFPPLLYARPCQEFAKDKIY